MENEVERLNDLISRIENFKIKKQVLEERIQEDHKALMKYDCDSPEKAHEMIKKLEADLKSSNIKLSRKLKRLERIVDDASEDMPF